MKRLRFTLAAAACVLLYPALTFAQQLGPQQQYWDCPSHMHMWGGGWGLWWVFPLFMMFVVFVCIAIFVLGHRSGAGNHHHWAPWQSIGRASAPGGPRPDPNFSALQILNERFAKGEIQKQEYEEKKAAILAK